MITLRSLFFCLIAVLAGLSMTACDKYNPTMKSLQSEPNLPSLAEMNYDAAEILMKQSRLRIDVKTPMIVATLGNVNNIEESTALGRKISEHVASRFVQRGYTISEVLLRTGLNVQSDLGDSTDAGVYMLSRDATAIAGEMKAAAVVVGTYYPAATGVEVNLRMVDVRTNKILASYDYALPMTSDVRTLLGENGISAGFEGSSYAY